MKVNVMQRTSVVYTIMEASICTEVNNKRLYKMVEKEIYYDYNEAVDRFVHITDMYRKAVIDGNAFVLHVPASVSLEVSYGYRRGKQKCLDGTKKYMDDHMTLYSWYRCNCYDIVNIDDHTTEHNNGISEIDITGYISYKNGIVKYNTVAKMARAIDKAIKAGIEFEAIKEFEDTEKRHYTLLVVNSNIVNSNSNMDYIGVKPYTVQHYCNVKLA